LVCVSHFNGYTNPLSIPIDSPYIDSQQYSNPNIFADVGLLGATIAYEWRPDASYGIRLDASYYGSIIGLFDYLNIGAIGRKPPILFRSSLSLEPRYFYNHRKIGDPKSDRRAVKYIACRLQYNTPLFLGVIDQFSPAPIELAYDRNPKSFKNFDLVPLWGLRTERRRVYFEFNAGYIIHLKGLFEDEVIFKDLRVRLLCRVGVRI